MPFPVHRIILRSLASCLALVAWMSAAVEAADYFPPPDSAGGWRTATNAAPARGLAGLAWPRLEQAWEFTQRSTQNGGLLVVRHGWLAFEKYFGRASRNVNPDMASTGKAYTSIVCGIMLQEFHDKIPGGLDTKVFSPTFLPEAYSRDDWKPIPRTPFHEGSMGGDDGIRRVLEMVSAAVEE